MRFIWYRQRHSDLSPFNFHILPSIMYWQDQKIYKDPIKIIIISWFVWSFSIEWGQSIIDRNRYL